MLHPEMPCHATSAYFWIVPALLRLFVKPAWLSLRLHDIVFRNIVESIETSAQGVIKIVKRRKQEAWDIP